MAQPQEDFVGPLSEKQQKELDAEEKEAERRKYRRMAAAASMSENMDQLQKAQTGMGDPDWAEYNPGMMGG